MLLIQDLKMQRIEPSAQEAVGVVRQWVPIEQVDPAEIQDVGHWILIADRQGAATLVQANLEQRGGTARVVLLRDTEAQAGQEAFERAPHDREQYAAFLAELLERKQCRGVVYLAGLDILDGTAIERRLFRALSTRLDGVGQW